MTILATSDKTHHERLIQIDNTPDMYTPHGRGGCWFSPTLLKVWWDNDGPRRVWVHGMKRNKNGDLGQQDTGLYLSVDENSRSELAPDWVLEIIGAHPDGEYNRG